MSKERCTEQVHKEDPRMKTYDFAYYNELSPYISGEVLDIGCGAGMFIKEYAKKDEVVSVLGIDKYIDEMPQEISKVTSCAFILPDELGVNKDSAKFDTIVSTEFLEHISREKLEEMLGKIKGLLKESGVFVGSTPNKIAPTTNPFHLYEYTLTELVSILKNYFSDVEAWDNGQDCILWVAKV